MTKRLLAAVITVLLISACKPGVEHTSRGDAQKLVDSLVYAGDAWLAAATPKFTVSQNGNDVGRLLDLCGNAHLQFKDARTSNYKEFVKAGLVRKTGNKVVEIQHKHKWRQEHGLQVACVEAAREVFKKHGVTDVRIWSYID